MKYELNLKDGKARFKDMFGCDLADFDLRDEKRASKNIIDLMRKLR